MEILALPVPDDLDAYEGHHSLGILRFRQSVIESLIGGIEESIKQLTDALVVLPELSLPRSAEDRLHTITQKLRVTIIAGVEHEVLWDLGSEKDLETGSYRVCNEFVVIPPNNQQIIRERKNIPAVVQRHTIVEPISPRRPPEFLLVVQKEVCVWPIICKDLLVLDRELVDENVRRHKVDLIAVLSWTNRSDEFRAFVDQLFRNPAVPISILYVNAGGHGGSFCVGYGDRRDWRERHVIGRRRGRFLMFSDWERSLGEARRKRGEL